MRSCSDYTANVYDRNTKILALISALISSISADISADHERSVHVLLMTISAHQRYLALIMLMAPMALISANQRHQR